jgi:hypothetical protein
MKRTAVTQSLCATLLAAAALSSAVRAATLEHSPVNSTYSAATLYDLGNFYARTGRPAMAVLNYERARVFAPRDPDIQANLRHVRETVGAPTPTRTGLSRHVRWGNPNTLYWIGVTGLMLAGFCLLLRRAGARHRTLLGGGAVLGVAFMLLAIGDAVATASTLHEAVAMLATAARAAPISAAEPIFTVPLVDVVNVREEHGAYDLITDSQGREGWVAGNDLQPVIPGGQRALDIQKVIRSLP